MTPTLRLFLLPLLAPVLFVSPAGAQQSAGRQVVFDRFGYRLNNVGETTTASAGVLDATLRQVPNASIQWRMDNPAIATVSARGVVTARGIGTTRLWAIAGRDSAAAVILVGVSGNVSSGVADSVKVDVGRRVARLEISDPPGQVPAGDTLRFHARVDNSVGARFADARLVWVSMNPGVVRVDAATGLARAVAPGDAIIIAQFGGVADTVRLSVAPRATSISLEPLALLPFVGDTLRIVAVARDAFGRDVAPDRSLALRSTRPGVALVIEDQRVLAVGPGSAWVVATMGALSDSIVVAVRGRTATIVVEGEVESPAPPRPALDSARTADLRSPSAVRIAGRLVLLTASVSRMAHSSRLARGLTEDRAGMIVGGSASASITPKLDLAADLGGGTLNGADAAGDLRLAEVRGQLTYWTRDWLALRLGYTRRSEAADIVLHRWQFANATALARLDFRGGAISSVSAFSLLPWGKFSGHRDATGAQVAPNRTSFAIQSGVELRWTALSAAISYNGERFSFPAVNGESRRDLFSSLRLRVGVQAGPVVHR